METYTEDIFNFFLERHIVLKEDWLSEALKYLSTIGPIRKDSENVCNLVFDQWKYSDLAVSSYPGFEQQSALQKTALKCFLTAPLVVQVVSVVDIGTSFHSQYNTLTYEFVDNSGFEAVAESNESNPWDTKLRRMIMMEVSDGSQSYRAIEYYSIKRLSLLVKPGCKMLLQPPLLCRRGIFMLKEQNCQLLGGDVADLMETGRPVDVMARRLNIDQSRRKKKDTPLTTDTSRVQPAARRTTLDTTPAPVINSSRVAPERRDPVRVGNPLESHSSAQDNEPRSSTNRSINRSLITTDGQNVDSFGNMSILNNDDFDDFEATQPLYAGGNDELNEGIIEEDSDDDANSRDGGSIVQAISAFSEEHRINRPADSSNFCPPSTSNCRSFSTGSRLSQSSFHSCSATSGPRGCLSTVVQTEKTLITSLEGSPPSFNDETTKDRSRSRRSDVLDSPEQPEPRESGGRKRSSALSTAFRREVSPSSMETVPLFDPRKRPSSQQTPSNSEEGKDTGSRLSIVDPRRRPSLKNRTDIRQFIATPSEVHSPPKKKQSTQKKVKVEVIELSDSDEEDVKPTVDKSLLRERTDGQRTVAVTPMVRRTVQSVKTSPREPPPSPVVSSRNDPFAWPPNPDPAMLDTFRQINILLFSEAVQKSKYAVGSTVRQIQAVVHDIVEPLRIVDGMWTQKVILRDESMDVQCFMANGILTELITLSPEEALSIQSSTDRSRQQDGARRLQAVELQMMRLDLVFSIEFYGIGMVDPVVRKVQTMPQALNVL